MALDVRAPYGKHDYRVAVLGKAGYRSLGRCDCSSRCLHEHTLATNCCKGPLPRVILQDDFRVLLYTYARKSMAPRRRMCKYIINVYTHTGCTQNLYIYLYLHIKDKQPHTHTHAHTNIRTHKSIDIESYTCIDMRTRIYILYKYT